MKKFITFLTGVIKIITYIIAIVLVIVFAFIFFIVWGIVWWVKTAISAFKQIDKLS